uniref:Uncharacterized protein n=1 Tax=Sphaerodactylus townsendi TaxID=933632 RepID=A0ACB8FN35_9SAUR
MLGRRSAKALQLCLRNMISLCQRMMMTMTNRTTMEEDIVTQDYSAITKHNAISYSIKKSDGQIDLLFQQVLSMHVKMRITCWFTCTYFTST